MHDFTFRSVPGPVLLAFLLLALAAPAPAAAQGDRLAIVIDDLLSVVSLPRSADATLTPLSTGAVRQLAYLPDGRLMAVREATEPDAGWVLAEILDDGTVRDVGPIAQPEDLGFTGREEVVDLEVDAAGRLFFLGTTLLYWNPPEDSQRLIELDPDDASSRSGVILSRPVGFLATAPQGFWAHTSRGLELLDPDTGVLWDPDVPGDQELFARDGATDSTGALWTFAEGVCSPPCFFAQRFDPATGDVQEVFLDINPQQLFIGDLAIQRRCVSSRTAACLQGGRFRAEVEWKDFAGATGPGRVAPARSADSAIFWFFDRANWELNVKVLDGCGVDGHYWVFASGSTNVEYVLRVTDLETGAVRTYQNPLGRIAVTETDTTAFVCSS